MSKGKGWIGIDLDGCLAHYEDFISPEYIGEPIPAMLERVKAWIAEGQEVRIFTARVAWFDGDEQSLKDSEAADAAIRLWCLKHIGVELPITNRKDYSMWKLYDDRCIQAEKNTGRLVETVPTAHVVQAIASSLIKWGLVAAIDRQVIQASITEATGTSTGVFSIPPEPRPLPLEAAWEDCLEEMRAYLYRGGTHYRGDFHANLGTEGRGGCVDLAELLAVYKHNFLTALLELKQPTESTPQAPTSDIARRLREYCVGQPAEIPWPHRILHEAADELDRLAASSEVGYRAQPAAGDPQQWASVAVSAGVRVLVEVFDFATGAKDSFCIGREMSEYKKATMEFWNPSGWAGSGYVFTDKTLADAVASLLNSQSPADLVASVRASAFKGFAEIRAEIRKHTDLGDEETLVTGVQRMGEKLAQWSTWGMIEIAIRNPSASSYMKEWEGRVEKAEAALKEIHDRINIPEVEDFDKAVPLEAVHQMQRWGAAHDAGKNPEDWFWLVGYLAGKALASFKVGDLEKAKHHCVSTAAAMRNWHAHIRSGESAMRPGISAEKQAAADRG